MLVRSDRNYTIFFFFFNDTATTEIYTLSLHDALPISRTVILVPLILTPLVIGAMYRFMLERDNGIINEILADRKSTRLNSSHANISYAVFCLKKKNKTRQSITHYRPQPHHPHQQI